MEEDSDSSATSEQVPTPKPAPVPVPAPAAVQIAPVVVPGPPKPTVRRRGKARNPDGCKTEVVDGKRKLKDIYQKIRNMERRLKYKEQALTKARVETKEALKERRKLERENLKMLEKAEKKAAKDAAKEASKSATKGTKGKKALKPAAMAVDALGSLISDAELLYSAATGRSSKAKRAAPVTATDTSNDARKKKRT